MRLSGMAADTPDIKVMPFLDRPSFMADHEKAVRGARRSQAAKLRLPASM